MQAPLRKDYYGKGKQPWDTLMELGWSDQFAAGNVIKYLRRTKGDRAGDIDKAVWYFGNISSNEIRCKLFQELSQDERELLMV